MSGRLNLANSNPVRSAIDSYNAVDNIFERRRQRDIAAEDRQRAIEDRKRDQQWQDKVRERQQQTWNKADTLEADEQVRREAMALQMQLDQMGNRPMSHDEYDAFLQQASPKVREYLTQSVTPQESAAAQQSVQEFHSGMQQIQQAQQLMQQGDRAMGRQQVNNAKEKIIASLNQMYKGELNQGAAREDVAKVLSKEITDLQLTPDGGVIPVLLVKGVGVDGSPVAYTAPATRGQGAGPDDPLNVLTPEQIAQNMDRRAALYSALERQRVMLGDTSAYTEAKKRTTTKKETDAARKLIGAAIKAYDPDASAEENYKNIYGLAIKQNPDVDPTKVAGAVQTMMTLENHDIAKRKNSQTTLSPGQAIIDTRTGEVIHQQPESPGKNGANGALKWDNALDNIRSATSNLARTLRNEGGTAFNFNQNLADEAVRIARDELRAQMTAAYIAHPALFRATYGGEPTADAVMKRFEQAVTAEIKNPDTDTSGGGGEEDADANEGITAAWAKSQGWDSTLKVDPATGEVVRIWMDGNGNAFAEVKE